MGGANGCAPSLRAPRASTCACQFMRCGGMGRRIPRVQTVRTRPRHRTPARPSRSAAADRRNRSASPHRRLPSSACGSRPMKARHHAEPGQRAATNPHARLWNDKIRAHMMARLGPHDLRGIRLRIGERIVTAESLTRFQNKDRQTLGCRSLRDQGPGRSSADDEHIVRPGGSVLRRDGQTCAGILAESSDARQSPSGRVWDRIGVYASSPKNALEIRVHPLIINPSRAMIHLCWVRGFGFGPGGLPASWGMSQSRPSRLSWSRSSASSWV